MEVNKGKLSREEASIPLPVEDDNETCGWFHSKALYGKPVK